MPAANFSYYEKYVTVVLMFVLIDLNLEPEK